MEEKPRLSRLTAILTQLQSQKLITVKQLAERHNVSIRTIYQDIEPFAIYSINGNFLLIAYYRMRNDFRNF